MRCSFVTIPVPLPWVLRNTALPFRRRVSFAKTFDQRITECAIDGVEILGSGNRVPNDHAAVVPIALDHYAHVDEVITLNHTSPREDPPLSNFAKDLIDVKLIQQFLQNR